MDIRLKRIMLMLLENPRDERTLDMRDSSEFVHVAHDVREALAHGHGE